MRIGIGISPVLAGVLGGDAGVGLGVGSDLQRLLALSPSLLIWPANGAGWQGTSGGTLAASGQPLGLGTDLSQLGGKTLGEWLATAANIRDTGVTGTAGTVSAPTYNTATGEASLPRVDGSNITFLTFAGTASKTYAVEINNTTANAVTVRSNATVLATISGNTTSVAVVTIAAGQTLGVYPSANGVTQTFTINYVRELPGNHYRAGTWASPSDAARASYVIQTDPALYDVSGQPELVTNGDFSDGLTGWVDASAGLAFSSVDAGQASINNGSGDGIAGIAKSFTTEVGKAYIVTCDVVSTTNGYRVGVGTAANNASLADTGEVEVAVSQRLCFIATGTTTFVNIYTFPNAITTANQTTVFDNISVKEVPAAQYKYALSFDGSSDYYSLLSAISITESMTVVRAFKRASAGINTVGLAFSGTAIPSESAWTNTNTLYGGRLGSTDGIATVSNTNTGSFVTTNRRNASTDTVRLNGTQVVSATAQTVGGTLTDFGRRTGSIFNSGEISFVAVFPSELTGANLTLVEQIAAATNGATLS
jgi:hypothetical protein